MVRFYSITYVREALDKYCKRDTYGYGRCKEDLCDFFTGKGIGVIFSNPILLSPSPDFRLIKSRIANSLNNDGSSGGYRLYYYVDIKRECV